MTMVATMARRRREGSQVLRTPHQLTCFPCTNIRAHRVTMFQLRINKLGEHKKKKVKPGASIVLHQIESPSHMTVAVVAAEVVHSLS